MLPVELSVHVITHTALGLRSVLTWGQWWCNGTRSGCIREDTENERLTIVWAATCPPCICFGGFNKAAAGTAEDTTAVGAWIKRQGHGWWDTWWLCPVLPTVGHNVKKGNSKGLCMRFKKKKNPNPQTFRSVEQREREGKKNPSNSLFLNYFQEHHDLIWEWFILKLNSQIKKQSPREPSLLISLFSFLSAPLIEV